MEGVPKQGDGKRIRVDQKDKDGLKNKHHAPQVHDEAIKPHLTNTLSKHIQGTAVNWVTLDLAVLPLPDLHKP